MHLAAMQHGLVSTYQAEVIGVGRSRLQSMQRRGVLIHAGRGVWALPGSPETERQVLLRPCLSYGGVASHRAAGSLHRIEAWTERPIELTVERSRSVDVPGGIVHRTQDLIADDIVIIDSIPVTSPARTLVDLGSVVPAVLVSRSVNHALRLMLTTIVELQLVADRVGRHGRSGAGVLRRVLDGKVAEHQLMESPLESDFLDLCIVHGLPAPSVQHPVRVNGRDRRLDVAWPSVKLCVELLGYEHHGQRERFEEDRRRTNDLQLAGWTVLEFTADDVRRRGSRTISLVLRMLDRLGYPG